MPTQASANQHQGSNIQNGEVMERNERLRRLIARIRNDARQVVRRDKRQFHLLTDLVRTLNLLEVEIFGLGPNVNVATKETEHVT